MSSTYLPRTRAPVLPRADRHEREETASRHDPMDRWLAVSEPLAVDDDPDWENADWECWSYESRTAVRC